MDTERKVIGPFPDFCYRGFDEKSHVEDFMQRGIFRLNCRYYCREMESWRGDPTEGEGHTREPGVIPVMWVSRNRSEKPIVTSEYGLQDHEAGYNNAIFLFCMYLPSVDPAHMRKRHEYIVRINRPEQLANDIHDYFVADGQSVLVVGREVVYNKGQELNGPLTVNERLDLSYKQKPPKSAADCEFRIVVFKYGFSCPQTCKYLDGQFEQVEPECKFIKVNLGKPLHNASLVDV